MNEDRMRDILSKAFLVDFKDAVRAERDSDRRFIILGNNVECGEPYPVHLLELNLRDPYKRDRWRRNGYGIHVFTGFDYDGVEAFADKRPVHETEAIIQRWRDIDTDYGRVEIRELADLMNTLIDDPLDWETLVRPVLSLEADNHPMKAFLA